MNPEAGAGEPSEPVAKEGSFLLPSFLDTLWRCSIAPPYLSVFKDVSPGFLTHNPSYLIIILRLSPCFPPECSGIQGYLSGPHSSDMQNGMIIKSTFQEDHKECWSPFPFPRWAHWFKDLGLRAWPHLSLSCDWWL